ncbi:MAG: glycosyltransferase family 4 protein [Candidatus Pacebacteria bacterium]|nr:glycosyltransferase family 4 protein [Candidatus Paceibacterota bacterium]
MRNKKKVVFLRSNPVNPDPRVENEISYLIENYEIEVLGWDRKKENKKEEIRKNFIIFRYQGRGRYGSGLRNIIPILKWWIYEFIWLLNRKVDFIHVCDFDTYLPALLVAKIKKKKIIYDIVDFYVDSAASTAPLFLKKIIKKIDLFLIQFADGVIIADDRRLNQIHGAKPKKVISLYNSPPDLYKEFNRNIENVKKNKKFIIGYFGLVEKNRGFDMIINIVSKKANRNKMNLIVFGEGPYMENIIRKIKNENIQNVRINKKIYYKKALEEFSKCDITFALYDPKVPNYRYSSPNKLFEAMMFGKPIIVNKNTSMDKIVEYHKCGIVVDYNNEEEIEKAIFKLIKLKTKSVNFYGEAGRNAYLKFFHHKVLREKLIRFYESVDFKK